jgi:hypothetical protein
MSREDTFSLRYTHSTPEEIEANELIRVLSAFDHMVAKASRSFYGSDASTSFRFTHVQSASIDIQGFIEILAGLQPTFANFPVLSLGVSDIPELIKNWLDLLKFLKGKPPKRIQQLVDRGNAVQIENASGGATIVNGNIYNACIFNNVGLDASKLEIPATKGARELELLKGRAKIASYTADDLGQFRPIKPAEQPIESEIEAIVEVVSPVFEGEGMWRFRYGRMSLTAKLVDQDYRERVSSGSESFRRGDHLKVRLKTVQERVGAKVVTKHFITKVLDRIGHDLEA